MKNNKGYSLIELIVVIFIMSIMIVLVSLGLRSIFSLDAKECAYDLNACLKETKADALSKDYQELKLYKNAAGEVYADFVVYHYQEDASHPGQFAPDLASEVKKSVLIGKQSVTVKFYFSDGTNISLDPATHSVALGFNRSSGSFTKAKIDDIQSTAYCNLIEVSRGSKTYSIKLSPATGNHSVK
ncbi:MAG: prepilin-type N-terminal cleavage/methylation domain-containing protein [Lachnospiraceae bacterium]|nr:prepilin-type N-terminal cleavage/methylation domain-containing protein [Lachnospiraceae bacterium]